MNVLMVGQNFHIVGGSDRVFFDEINLLESHGHRVAPFCAASSRNLETSWARYFPDSASFESPSIVDVAKYIYSISAKTKMHEIITDFSPDVAHFHIYYGKLTASIIAPLRLRGVPIVQTLHEYKAVCPTYTLTANGEFCDACTNFKFFNAALKCCNKGSFSRSLVSSIESYVSLALGSISNVDHFISVSDFLRNKVISMGVPAEKITTVYNYIDLDDYFPNYIAGDYFIFFGRVEVNKGIWPLVNAFKELKNVRLLVVGEGGALNEVKKYCKDFEIFNIDFLGFKAKSDLLPLIQGAICAVVPSIWNETFGLTVAEALACGKPVIASRIGGIPEVVNDGVDSILVNPGDVCDLVSAINKINNNKSLSVEMGRAGRISVEIKFSKEKHFSELTEVYKNVLR